MTSATPLESLARPWTLPVRPWPAGTRAGSNPEPYILDCGPGDLIEPFLVERKTRRPVTDPETVIDLHDTNRARRARIIEGR